MSRYSQVQCFQAYIGQKCIHRRLAGTHISHQLCYRFLNIGFFPEFLCVNNTMIRFIRCGQTRKFFFVSFPVKVSTVHDTATQCHGMSIHIFCRGMRDDIHTKLKWLAVDRCCKGIITDHRYSMVVCQIHKFCNIKYNTCRIGNCLGKYCFCIRFKVFFQFFFRQILIHQIYFHSETMQGNG